MPDERREFTRRDTFEEYRLLLMSELDRTSAELRNLNTKIEQFRNEDVSSMKTDIALLKLQATLYGAIAGLIATGAITLIVKYLHP
jgi:hypothetical protein